MNKVMKKVVYLLLVAILMFTVVACGGNAGSNNADANNETNNNDENLSLGDLADLVEEADELMEGLDELSENQDDIDEQKEEASKNLSNVADVAGVTYTVLSSEIVEGVYELDPGYEAVKVDLLVENTTSELSSVNSLFNCKFTAESGEEYYEEAFAGGDIKGDLVNPIGPGKTLRGEILLFSQASDENFMMEVEDFFAGTYGALAFEKNKAYDESVPVSSADGKGLGDEIQWHELLTFAVNSAEIIADGDQSYISIKMQAKNLTADAVDEYMIPFVLIDENGYDCDMYYMQDSYVIAGVPGGGEQEIELMFEVEDPEVKNYDLYLQPFAEDPIDVVRVTVE